MKRAEREAIMKQGVIAPETPRDRRQRAGLEADLSTSPLTGRPLPLRLRNFRVDPDGYLASLGGPLPYMMRLREIDALTDDHLARLASAWRAEAALSQDENVFSRRWRACVARWSFDEVNDLIERHNRWYPAESRLRMDPRTGDYALVNGAPYRRSMLDADWALERFPADRAVALAG